MDSNRIIKETEVKNALLADLIENWTWEFDFRTNESYISPHWVKFLGYELEEAENNKNFWLTITHPEDMKLVQERINERISKKSDFFSLRYRVKTKNGVYKWVLSEAKIKYDEKENPLFMIGFHLNVDPLNLAKESSQKFYTLFNSISDAVFITSADVKNPGAIIEVNINAEKLTGLTRAELIKMHSRDLSPNHIEESKEVEIRKLIEYKGSYFLTTTILTKDNKIIPVEVNSTKVELNNEILHVSVVRDISERIHAQESLRESEALSRKIVQMAPIGAIIYQNNIITYINDTGVKVLGGTSKRDFIGKPIESIIHKYYWEVSSKRRAYLKYRVTLEPIEMDFVRCDGSVISAELHTIPITFKGEIAELSYFKDITEQKRIFEEKQKLLEHTLEYDRIKTEFFSNISHELRTPLNIILSSIQLLDSVYSNKDIEPEKFFSTYENYTGAMKQNSYRLLKLINNLIDITKIDTGFIKTQLRNQNIIETVENISMSVIPYLKTKDISLIFDTDIEEKIMAFDENQIERILLNLLSNAVKFMNPGGNIDIVIKDRKDSIDIVIRDTGCGIPEDKLQVIFDRFRQVDSLLTRRTEGSGIGLSLVKSLVEAHEGTIGVESIIGEGSKFIINLPSKIIDESSNNAFIPDHLIKDNESKIDLINIEFSDIYS